MSSQSMTDIAYAVLSDSKEPKAFKELWGQVRETLQMSDAVATKKISQFYTNLNMDDRFTLLKDNMWDLKKRFKFEDTYVDTNVLEEDDSEASEFDEEEDGETSQNNSEEY